MEQLNSVSLRGIIGSVRVQDIQGHKMAHFTVATNYMFKTSQGDAVIETTWSNCVAWDNGKSIDFDSLKKGMSVEVEGRLRNQRYTAADGTERNITEIIVRDVKILEGHLAMESGL